MQMVNYLLSKYNYQLNYTKLIKLLYLADREALDKWGFSVSGDTYSLMRQGAVLGRLYDFIKADKNIEGQPEWNSTFCKDKYDLVSRVQDKCSYDELSRAEKRLLDEVDAKYHDKSWQYLVDEVIHKLEECREYDSVGSSSVPIFKQEILKALRKKEKDIEHILEEESASRAFSRTI